MHVKSHKDKIEFGRYLLDFIHSDVSGSYIPNCFGAKYYIKILNDHNKTLEIVLFSSKNRVLSTFDLFWKYNKYEKACI